MKARIAMLPGDGIGPEVTRAARRLLASVADIWEHEFAFSESLIGGAAIDVCGEPLPEESLATCGAADAVLLGAIGGPKWDDPRAKVRPEQGLLGLRKHLGVFANLRPVRVHPSLYASSPLKVERLEGTDMIVVRELTGGIYFGEKGRSDHEAYDVCRYSVAEVERIARVAFRLAQGRGNRIISVDKANVLETSRLWRATVDAVGEREFPEISIEHMLVDAAAMHMLNAPTRFDVVLTENMFGDILTDEASMLAGSLGMLPSASLSKTGPGIFEPIHGSAPDIAGLGIANPCGTILSAALLLRNGLNLADEAAALEQAVYETTLDGIGTPDLGLARGKFTTEEVTSYVVEKLRECAEKHTYNQLAMNISALGF